MKPEVVRVRNDMGIWRVLSGKVICDNCGKVLAHLEFDAKDELTIEHVRTWCYDCYMKLGKAHDFLKTTPPSEPPKVKEEGSKE